MNKTNLLKKSAKWLKIHSPTILTCIGGVGVIAVSVLSSKAALKAEASVKKAEVEKSEKLNKREFILKAAPAYIPTAIVGVSTLICIFGANALNRKQQASLISAYTFLNNSYQEYKKKTEELYGKEAHENILNSLCVEKSKEDHYIYTPSFVGNMCLDFQDAYEEELLFYDSVSKRYFQSTISRVLQAEYHINRNLIHAGAVSLNDFYELLGIEDVDFGEGVGWSTCNGDMFWLDFDHIKSELDDGLVCYIIEPLFNPDASFLEDL